MVLNFSMVALSTQSAHLDYSARAPHRLCLCFTQARLFLLTTSATRMLPLRPDLVKCRTVVNKKDREAAPVLGCALYFLFSSKQRARALATLGPLRPFVLR